jgi:hypothetical protein
MAMRAYVEFAGGKRSSFLSAFVDFRAPAPALNWINSDRYEVQAKAKPEPSL